MTAANGFSPQEAVERALAVSRSDDCVVIAEETSGANLRWAGNTLTTNGVSRSRQLSVIAIDRRGDGAAAGVVSRAGVRPGQIEDVVREAEHTAAESGLAEDVGLRSADGLHRTPEIGGRGLIGHVPQLSGQLAALDLEEPLPGELEVVPLHVDGPALVAQDVDAVFHLADQVRGGRAGRGGL